MYNTVSTYDPRPRPLPIPFRPGPAPSGNFFIGFCFRFCSEISESPDELPESPLTILLQSGYNKSDPKVDPTVSSILLRPRIFIKIKSYDWIKSDSQFMNRLKLISFSCMLISSSHVIKILNWTQKLLITKNKFSLSWHKIFDSQ